MSTKHDAMCEPLLLCLFMQANRSNLAVPCTSREVRDLQSRGACSDVWQARSVKYSLTHQKAANKHGYTVSARIIQSGHPSLFEVSLVVGCLSDICKLQATLPLEPSQDSRLQHLEGRAHSIELSLIYRGHYPATAAFVKST